MHQNILITSAGRRVELLQEFQRELNQSFPDGEVMAVDLNPGMAPACHTAARCFAVPEVTDSQYIQRLLEICTSNGVRIVIPTIDTELSVLSENRALFQQNGIETMVSDTDFIKTCGDKRKTIELFDRLGIKSPQIIDKYNPVYPIFVKPFDGSSSIGTRLIGSSDELTHNILHDPKLIFMEYIDKKVYTEYTVDMYYGNDNRVKSIVPRERIEVRSGETNKGATRKNYLVKYLYDRMERMPGVRGCICVQLFYRESDNDVIGIEINPRFGGGYPLSYYAGANFPAMMIKEYIEEKKLDYSEDWIDNTIMLRYDSQVIFHE